MEQAEIVGRSQMRTDNVTEMNKGLGLFTRIMRAQIAIRSLLSNLVLICGHSWF